MTYYRQELKRKTSKISDKVRQAMIRNGHAKAEETVEPDEVIHTLISIYNTCTLSRRYTQTNVQGHIQPVPLPLSASDVNDYYLAFNPRIDRRLLTKCVLDIDYHYMTNKGNT